MSLQATPFLISTNFEYSRGGGLHSREVAQLLLTQKPQVRFPAFPKNFKGNVFNVVEVTPQRWLEESGQCLKMLI